MLRSFPIIKPVFSRSCVRTWLHVYCTVLRGARCRADLHSCLPTLLAHPDEARITIPLSFRLNATLLIKWLDATGPFSAPVIPATLLPHTASRELLSPPTPPPHPRPQSDNLLPHRRPYCCTRLHHSVHTLHQSIVARSSCSPHVCASVSGVPRPVPLPLVLVPVPGVRVTNGPLRSLPISIPHVDFRPEAGNISFHLPLHRNLASLIQGTCMKAVLPVFRP
jgi:hypothetical protein